MSAIKCLNKMSTELRISRTKLLIMNKQQFTTFTSSPERTLEDQFSTMSDEEITNLFKGVKLKYKCHTKHFTKGSYIRYETHFWKNSIHYCTLFLEIPYNENDSFLNTILVGDHKCKVTPYYYKQTDFECEIPSESVCALCLCEIDNWNGVCKPNSCQHFFHIACVEEWLSTKHSCPICRRVLSGHNFVIQKV